MENNKNFTEVFGNIEKIPDIMLLRLQRDNCYFKIYW